MGHVLEGDTAHKERMYKVDQALQGPNWNAVTRAQLKDVQNGGQVGNSGWGSLSDL